MALSSAFSALRNIFIMCGLVLFIFWFTLTQPIIFSPSITDTPDISPAILESHVRTLSETLPKQTSSFTRLNATTEWIEQQLAVFTTSKRQSYKIKGINYHNILVDFGPESSENNENSELIVVGAHYDVAHNFPGADDNASGVAALIEIAKRLSEQSLTLNKRIQLAFYSLEEPPYFRTDAMGSFVHAKSLKDNDQAVNLMISLDMIGYFSDEEGSQHFPFRFMDKLYSDKGNFIAIIGDLSNIFPVRAVKNSFKRASELPVYSMNAPKLVPGVDFSDHLNFWYHDYPAVMITDTSFNRNTHYHTALDTADRLDYEKMAEVTKGLYQAIIDLSKE